MEGNVSRVLVKAELRKAMKRLLSALSQGEKASQSTVVANKVEALPAFQNARRVAFFLSMPEEVDTNSMLKTAFATGKECFVPRYTKTDMEMYQVRDLDDIKTLPLTKWNIPQPEDIDARKSAMDAGGLDMIIVPGLAFSRDGGRLGRGKGYYDKYIQKCNDFAAQTRRTAPQCMAAQDCAQA
ncbi:hypothetical protein PTSG_12124 [Salpingoeca rosetta]|uniref:5-formyltetrahydrofolate cyclo-ligase n=1 Tax=Salpingoeca rosetta (strain ATCC 50818 / BSB-021) TaxID=946362 RepID=F2U7N9_SALR5|nr:uncharacterized protein PTSG_12124 [Salpingoeca rosetta]EGD83456.1 hypothetical protein PTSG_12124 [Salpingoeca rosetta]|eukprot:XP_004994960.1 hypothetical protein PTSG_12124 [Salpingoeca rosetta]